MTSNRSINTAFCIALALAGSTAHAAVTADEVIDTYCNIAEAAYTDALTTAKQLHSTVDQLIQTPSASTLDAARNAWRAARAPYQQTEVYRFGNRLVDEWEGKVNAWPLDEGLIDYVDTGYYGAESEENALYTANVVANQSLSVNGQQVDASTITPKLLSTELQEAGGIETNVASGYHAIEFLLWGQDLNGSNAGAGARSHSDYDTANCTNNNCDRRAQYLLAASELLVADLEYMAAAWAAEGEARLALVEAGDQAALSTMLTGMGSLSYGELAGERMQLGLMLHDPEEEHDCFSDNTAASHYYDGLGIQNVFIGQYHRVNGDIVKGASLAAYIKQHDAALANEMTTDIDSSVTALNAVLDSQHNGKAYDQLIAEGDKDGNALVQTAIDALIKQTKGIERAVVALGVDGVSIEGSESLDDPSSVFH